MKVHNHHSRERGIALLLALLALMAISAIGLGMMYMSNTEGSINGNYKDTQVSFFSMRGGLEEMRDRMRANSGAPITLPATMPGAAANSILYIINPAGASDTVDPKNSSNQYYDDEFCHETFTQVALTNPGSNVPCPASSAPPGGSVAAYVNSFSPHNNTASALKYKWTRITLKQNGTFPNALVDGSQATSSQVCWDSLGQQEVAVTALGYSTCAAAQAAGINVTPVYLVTSMAIGPRGSRRIGQYEVGAFNIAPPPAALALDGPAANFNPAPNSANYFANGNDNGVSGYTGPGTCTPSGPGQVPAISTGDAAGQTNVTGQIPSNRTSNYTGTPGSPNPTPSVVNAGSSGTNQLSGAWSSPAQLNQLVSTLANVADVTYSCGIGTPCSGSGPYGTDAAPRITYVNGDFNYGPNSGAGVLIVTGTLSITGNSSFDGLILVIGQGILTENGSGGGQFNGSIFLAATNSSTSPYSQLTTLASPLISWNGGGTNGIQYNSCWANIGNNMQFSVIASREEMY